MSLFKKKIKGYYTPKNPNPQPELYRYFQTDAHFLIGGCTGSGKSVLLNNIICDMLGRYTPNEIKLFLIDPKKVELTQYKNISHVVKYATDSRQAIEVLNLCIATIDIIYKQLEKENKRKQENIKYFIVIDEVADLMLSDERKTIEKQLQKIAQIGRAAGFHLIIATQVIRADILTPKITSNLDNRIALRCTNSLESRQILGMAAAECLPRFGYCIVKSPQNVELKKYNVPYISEKIIEGYCKIWDKQNGFFNIY